MERVIRHAFCAFFKKIIKEGPKGIRRNNGLIVVDEVTMGIGRTGCLMLTSLSKSTVILKDIPLTQIES